MIRILLAEDHNIVRNGICMLLECEKDISIVAQAANGKQALDLLQDNVETDIILADINMPEMDGISLLKELKKLNSTVKIIILSMHDNEKYISQSFQEGAEGYLLKSVSADELIFAIKHVHNGSKYICAELSMNMLDRLFLNGQPHLVNENSTIEFSLREIEVLHLIAEGLTNVEISDKLFISKRTVEGHRQALINKTGARNTAALVRFTILNGILKL